MARRWSWAAFAAGILLLGQSARAQGCVMCYTTALQLNKSGATALDKAIIVLWIPPALIFSGIFAYVYRRRGSWRDPAAG
jgi:hypothetical protein